MKVQLLADNLQKKLLFINHAITTKSHLPILQNILLETENGKLSIYATDLEIGIKTQVEADIVEEGGITIPAKVFIELINSLSSEKLTLETKENALTVVSKKTKSVFQTIAKDEFPKLYEEKGEHIATIKTDLLRQNIVKVVFVASQDTTRPSLSGVFLKQEEKGFLLVATDGYRLSLKHLTMDVEPKKDIENSLSLIVPGRIFKEVLAIREESETVSIFISKTSNQILFEQGNTILVGRLIEGEFPKYERIIPSDYSARISFDREELQKAVKICSIFAKDAANIVKISLRKDQIIVSSQTQSLGENTVEVEATLQGEENEIAFNSRYLLDILSNLEENELEFEMTGPLNPGVFKIKNDPSFLHLIMPIRIQA